jgi:hypothetical protein
MGLVPFFILHCLHVEYVDIPDLFEYQNVGLSKSCQQKRGKKKKRRRKKREKSYVPHSTPFIHPFKITLKTIKKYY